MERGAIDDLVGDRGVVSAVRPADGRSIEAEGESGARAAVINRDLIGIPRQ